MTLSTHKQGFTRILLVFTMLGVLLPACNSNPPQPTAPANVTQVVYETYRDEFLGIEFSYPPAWGQIEMQLETCYYSGYKYKYVFQGETIATGGTGFDCAEGRSTEFMDYPAGYKGREVCDFLGQRCLEEPASEDFVHLTLVFPEAERICLSRYANMTVYRIYGAVTVDLPEHPFIHGMIWLVPLLNAEREAELMGKIDCDGDATAEYTQAITSLMEEIASGTSDAETQAVVESLRYLANSVRRIPTRPYEFFMPTPTPEAAGIINVWPNR